MVVSSILSQATFALFHAAMSEKVTASPTFCPEVILISPSFLSFTFFVKVVVVVHWDKVIGSLWSLGCWKVIG